MKTLFYQFFIHNQWDGGLMEKPFKPFDMTIDYPPKVKALLESNSLESARNIVKTFDEHPQTGHTFTRALGDYWVRLGLRTYIEQDINIISQLEKFGVNVPQVIGYKQIRENKHNMILLLKVPKDLRLIKPGEKFSSKAKENYFDLLEKSNAAKIHYPALNECTLMFSPETGQFLVSSYWLAELCSKTPNDTQGRNFTFVQTRFN